MRFVQEGSASGNAILSSSCAVLSMFFGPTVLTFCFAKIQTLQVILHRKVWKTWWRGNPVFDPNCRQVGLLVYCMHAMRPN